MANNPRYPPNPRLPHQRLQPRLYLLLHRRGFAPCPLPQPPMAILNYTTKIDASKTVAELTELLSKAGCQKVVIDYDDTREPTALTFTVPVNRQPIFFTLSANSGGVLAALRRHKAPVSYCNLAQARRVAWRIIKAWCEAQLAIIDAGQAQLAEVFLPYAQTPNGQTLYHAIEAGSLKLLN